jgi:hypothetical protein
MQARFAAEPLRNAKRAEAVQHGLGFFILRRRASMTYGGQITRRSHVVRRASTLC